MTDTAKLRVRAMAAKARDSAIHLPPETVLHLLDAVEGLSNALADAAGWIEGEWGSAEEEYAVVAKYIDLLPVADANRIRPLLTFRAHLPVPA